MLKFLSSLFAGVQIREKGPDEMFLEAAIERVIDGTDHRLRGLNGYQQRLRSAVETAVVHIIRLVDSFPAATEISRRTYGADPRLRAFFASAGDLQAKIAGSKTVIDFLKTYGTEPPDEIFGVLSMEWEKRNVLGMELHGDVVQRDVPQVVVNFFHHHYLAPAASEAESRWQTKVRGFDYLIQQALIAIVATRSKRAELVSQHQLLQRKLDALQQGGWGLEGIQLKVEHATPGLTALENEILAVETELGKIGAQPEELEQSLQQIIDIFGNAEQWLTLRKVHLTLTDMSVMTEDALDAGANVLQLDELFSPAGISRILLLGRFPRAELPLQLDFLKEVERYLG